MGCSQSKIENEEIVSRCKDRKQHMKSAVSARNAFAAAHSAYPISLKNTGAALSDFAHAQSHHAGADDFQPLPSSSADAAAAVASLPRHSPFDPLPPPPPPVLDFTPPLQRAVSMPELSIPKPDFRHSEPIIEEENEEDESNHGLRHRSTKSSGGGVTANSESKVEMSAKESESNGVASPPYPARPNQNERSPPPPPPPEAKGMSWDYWFPPMDSVPAPSLDDLDVERSRMDREEIQHRMHEERPPERNEVDSSGTVGGGAGDGSGIGEMRTDAGTDADVEENPAELPPQISPPPAAIKESKSVKLAVPPEEKRKAPTGVSLLQIFTQLDDCFLKASESALEVSKMLEANRLHYHSNFADNRGHIDHSSRVMRVITWNRSFKNLSIPDDDRYDSDSEENESHATVLDKMLAWEKKLYDEVKAGEQMKHEYQRKVAALNRLKKRGSNPEALERMKAAVSHLHTRYIVDMQSMDSTVSEINRLRDDQLYPRLVTLVDEMTKMWHSMHEHHENQSRIVVALRYISNSQVPTETSDYHHERTLQLLSVVQEWRSQFDKLITHQKQYIKALNDWLKLNLIPIDNNLREKVSSPQRPQNAPIQALLYHWHDHLEKLQDEVARTALDNFTDVINTIIVSQDEEMKLRNRCRETQKELARKTRQFEDWYQKFMQKRTPTDEMDPENTHDKDLIAERQAVVEAVSCRLQEEEEAYKGKCLQVREKSLKSLISRLPELFRAMSHFSYACAEMYGKLGSFPANS